MGKIINCMVWVYKIVWRLEMKLKEKENYVEFVEKCIILRNVKCFWMVYRKEMGGCEMIWSVLLLFEWWLFRKLVLVLWDVRKYIIFCYMNYNFGKN